MSQMVERVAEIIYDGVSYDGPAGTQKPAWTENGNSLMQDEARRIATRVLQAAREPTIEMKRALIKHRGYDPDAKEETLDRLGQLDIATMGVYVQAYKAMLDGALK